MAFDIRQLASETIINVHTKRIRHTKPHVCQVHEKHNYLKVMVLLYLSWQTEPVSLRTIAKAVPVNYHSLANALRKWISWKHPEKTSYVIRSIGRDKPPLNDHV